MTDLMLPSDLRPERANWLRLRTLIFLRWMAVGGQLSALLVADVYYGMLMPLGLCYLAVGTAAIANLVSGFVFPANKRLTEAQAMLTLLFDLSQLSLLLFLTGGLTNPFALLLLAPVTVAASALELRTTVVLGILAAIFITLLGLFNLPLRYADGGLFGIPILFKFGFWLSILIGIAFIGLYSRRISTEMHSMSDALLATQMALAREQKLTDLGGVVAAAAHELGTPLATIKLISTEMIAELAAYPQLQEDARLIRVQTDRCRDILRSMGTAGKDDLHMRQAPLSTVLHEAAEPHLSRGKEVIFKITAGPGGSLTEPLILRRPELIHGLRNLIQNAVDFAKSRVWVDGYWSAERLIIRILDDGDGIPSQVLGRIGDPFVRVRKSDQGVHQRPGYEGMGLGLFIAKTLLERTGAELSFANAADSFLADRDRHDCSGAIVELAWPIDALVVARGGGLGENQKFV